MNARLAEQDHGKYAVLDTEAYGGWDITRLSYHRGRASPHGNYTILYLDGALLGEAYTFHDREMLRRHLEHGEAANQLFPYVVLDGKRVYLRDLKEMIQ